MKIVQVKNAYAHLIRPGAVPLMRCSNLMECVDGAVEFVKRVVTYDPELKVRDPRKLLAVGKGDCLDVSSLYVSMFRKLGLRYDEVFVAVRPIGSVRSTHAVCTIFERGVSRTREIVVIDYDKVYRVDIRNLLSRGRLFLFNDVVAYLLSLD